MHLFDRDISFEHQDTNLFVGKISPNWSINGVPDGGYLLAILAHGVLQQAPNKSISIFTANFISKCSPGEASISVEKFGSSKQFDRFQAILSQKGKERVRAIGTLTTDNCNPEEKRYEKPGPDIKPLAACVPFPELPQYTLFNQMDVRLDPRSAGWLTGDLADKSEQKGWIKFKQDRPFDALSVLLAADAFPPPVLASFGMIAWVPTLELSVNIRELPQSQWLKCVFRSHFITGNIVEEDAEIWDEKDALIAIARQVSQFRKNK